MSRTRRTYALTAAVAAIVTAANASQGAYFSQSWGWVALAFLLPTTVLLILERASAPGRLRIAFASLTGALAVWIALSSLWSISAPASLRELERMLVYVAVALAIALVLRRGDAPGVFAGIGLGVLLVCGYALATRLFPDRLHTYDDPYVSNRLAEPLGYWNALGLLATLGLLVVAGFVAHSRRVGPALLGAAALPVLATTLYFTFSRGAWAALIIGFAVAVVVDPRRLRLVWTALGVAVPTAVCIAYASRLDALTTEDALPASAAREGHRLAVVVAVAAVTSALMALAVRSVARRVPASRRSRRAFDVGLIAFAVAAVAVALVSVGGPAAAFDKLDQRFNADPVVGVDLNDRLFSVSGNGRSEQIRVAWDAGRERPLVGQGSGTFEYLWYERRPNLLVVRDGHSLYMETFAELGLVGLALLVSALLALAVGGVRARRQRFLATGVGALAAWAAASAFDWHWEMVGVTLTALLAGGAGLVASERGASRSLGLRARGALVAAGVLLSVFATWSLVGNQALFAARDALGRKDWSSAGDHGRRARSLLFWSYEPDVVLGDAAAGSGDRDGALRAYRDAVAADPNNWVTWLRLAQVARGPERAAAYDRVRQLNPREEGLPGE
jgi:O-antigen ligase